MKVKEFLEKYGFGWVSIAYGDTRTILRYQESRDVLCYLKGLDYFVIVVSKRFGCLAYKGYRDSWSRGQLRLKHIELKEFFDIYETTLREGDSKIHMEFEDLNYIKASALIEGL